MATLAAIPAANGAEPAKPAAVDAAAGAKYDVTSLPLPDAEGGGFFFDYMAYDPARNRIWVPAGGTGNTAVVDAATREIHAIKGFATSESPRRPGKRTIGPSSASVGDGVVYVGDRADSSVCAFDAESLEKRGCVTLPSMPDGLAFVAATKEVWVTAPSDGEILVLDVSKPAAPALGGSIKLEGSPEGYAVDQDRGIFYTNLEDKDRTLRIEASSRKATADWSPDCGERGPRGLAFEPEGGFLMVACTDHVAVLDAGHDGAVISKLESGDGVDNLGYHPAKRMLYVAASRAGTLTVARLDEKGSLERTASVPTAEGAWNAVVTQDGTAYLADGRKGRILAVTPGGPGAD